MYTTSANEISTSVTTIFFDLLRLGRYLSLQRQGQGEHIEATEVQVIVTGNCQGKTYNGHTQRGEIYF